MAKYTGNILTNLGKDLLARAVIGGEVITFTKVELGKGVIAGGNQEEFTELIDSFKVLPITSTAKLEGGSYRVRAAFSNSGIVEDTHLREIGVFARGEDGVELLYSYCNTDSPDLIPAEGAGVLERVEDVIIYISNATNINAVIDQSKVYATIKDLTEGLATKEDKFSKNTAFNKNFGAGQDEVSKGNHGHTSEDVGAEPKFDKNTGFNLNKSDSVASTSTTTLATSKAAKTAYDKGKEALDKANSHNHSASNITSGTMSTSRLPSATTSGKGIVQLSSSTSSTSTSYAATPAAIKSINDAKYNKSSWSRNTGSTGYLKLPNGTILQWGSISTSGSGFGSFSKVTFPMTFPNAVRRIYFTTNGTTTNSTSDIGIAKYRSASLSTTGFDGWATNRGTGYGYFAIGY